MTNNILADLIKRAASTEATPALVDFWQRQYSLSLGSKASYDPDKQTGFIDLITHLTADKKDIDHQVLQQTIAILVRFLDAVTEDQDYRSIHLSVHNFEEFLKVTDTPPQIGVDYIGGLIADFAYRASENLAHEKGAFKALQSLPKHIRPVEYEMWSDDHQNNKNGQELSTMFDDETIAQTPWKLLLRRNFAILDFPHELIYWDKWRDSYNSTNNMKMSIPVTSSAMLDDISTSDTTQEAAFETDFDFGDEEMDDKVEEMPTQDNHEQTPPENEVSLEELKTELTSEIIPDSPIEEHETATTDTQADQNFFEDTEQNNENTEDLEFEKEVLVEEIEHEQKEEALQDELVIGELVKVIDQNSPWKDQVLQVVEIQNGAVKLAGNDENLAQVEWHKDQLIKQNLYELLGDLNQKNQISPEHEMETAAQLIAGKDFTLPKAAAVIFNNQNQVLLFKDNQNTQAQWSLPSVDIKINQIPEEAIVSHLQATTQSNVRILDEVGSVMCVYNPNDISSQNSIYNIFLIDIDPDLETDETTHQYFDLENLPSAQIVVKVALDKHKRHQKLISDIISSRTTEWEKSQKSQIEENIKAEYEAKLREHIEQLNHQKAESKPQESEIVENTNPAQFNFHGDIYDQNAEPEIEESTMRVSEYDMAMPTSAVTNSNLAKFKVKLDTMIHSKEFGGINLTLGYTSKGIESISFSESSLDANLKSNLELILHLFNHLLSHGLDLKQLLSGLNLRYGQNEVPITEVLSLVLQAIADAPSKISEIGDNMLI
jgi:hypothetical protein